MEGLCYMCVCYMSLEKVLKNTFQVVNMVLEEGGLRKLELGGSE